jgi:hypothetical protein
MLGSEGFLTLTIKMRVRPEPECEEELVDLLKRYRDALNHSVEKIVEKRATSLSRAHALLYRELSYGLLQGSAFNSQVLAQQSEQRDDAEGEDFEALANAEPEL